MAQVFTLGRAGLATAAGGDGLCLRASDWSQEGDEVTVSGVIRGSDFSSLADAKALRDQVAGYDLNTDEPVVPVTWTVDSSRDGFYRVQSVSVDAEVTGRQASDSTAVGKLAWNWEAELLRVPGWQAPLFEEPLSGNVRANSHSVTIGTVIPAWTPPVGAYAIVGPSGYSPTSVTGADGALSVYSRSGVSAIAEYPSFAVAAADAYKGCCRIETSGDSGSTWRTVVGRNVINRPTYVRVSNSLVRVTTTTTSSVTELSIEWHDGSQWETAKVFRLTSETSYTDYPYAPTALTVTHNRPESVGIQLTAESRYLYVTLRRGSRVVAGLVDPIYTLPAANYGWKLTSAETATDITGGIRATNNDAAGNKFVLATSQTVTDTDNTNGRIRVNQDQFRFAIANAIGGTVGTGFNETQGLVYEYLAAVNGRQSIVAR